MRTICPGSAAALPFLLGFSSASSSDGSSPALAGGMNVISACGLAMAVCSRYASTLTLPRWYRASRSMATIVPVPELVIGKSSVSTSTVTSGLFLVVSIASSMWWAGLDFLGLVWMTMGLPVVIRPYMPAAEMPMPCWPRDIFMRWNFEP